MTDEEYRKKVIELLKLMAPGNSSQQGGETARNNLAELIKENNFPNILFHPEHSKEEGRFTLMYTGLCSQLAKELRNEEKRAKKKPEAVKSGSIVPIQCRDSKGFEQLKQTRIITDRDFNLLYNNPKQGTKIEGDFNYRTKWIHDVFTHELTKWHRSKMFPFEIDVRAFEKSIQEETVAIIAKNFSNLRGKFRIASVYFYHVIRAFLNYEFVNKKKKKEAGFQVLNFGDLRHQDRQMLGLEGDRRAE